ncbi:cytochrome c oxidase subunit II [Nitrosomonas sp.]|uniref:cytochrome c oxidase subunit II n=1 Tax=Nitrosomonas sp. TaxID=42353 RepID=UPI0025E48EC1|nr:cytochrome c oxidase subunit II [Nitrosomonas sp.]
MKHNLYMTPFLVISITAIVVLPNAVQASEAPLNYFLHSYGPAAKPTMYLGWVLAGLSVIICIVISLLLLTAIIRKRSRSDPYSIDREGGGLLWIYIGTGISTIILFGLVIYSSMILNQVAKPTQTPALTVTVTGYDWWWKVEYEHDDPTQHIITANELHIPVGLPVLIKLKSADVIHAFWVPKLAGKTQMIPGLVNQQWIQADMSGIYAGQCVQFCGAGHAHMGLEVIAKSPQEFEDWQNTQRKTAMLSFKTFEDPGYKVFMDQCAGCHTIRGTEAAGKHAPDLTHLNSRRKIAAGLLANTPDHLKKWIMNAQELKPGSRMPSFALSNHEIAALMLFLSNLD